jgi:hypothetical protein
VRARWENVTLKLEKYSSVKKIKKVFFKKRMMGERWLMVVMYSMLALVPAHGFLATPVSVGARSQPRQSGRLSFSARPLSGDANHALTFRHSR